MRSTTLRHASDVGVNKLALYFVGPHKEVCMFIGLMGVGNDGMLVTPSGRNLFRLPLRLAALVQRIQHWVAQQSWRCAARKSR
jgi:hypothetical protein